MWSLILSSNQWFLSTTGNNNEITYGIPSGNQSNLKLWENMFPTGKSFYKIGNFPLPDYLTQKMIRVNNYSVGETTKQKSFIFTVYRLHSRFCHGRTFAGRFGRQLLRQFSLPAAWAQGCVGEWLTDWLVEIPGPIQCWDHDGPCGFGLH